MSALRLEGVLVGVLRGALFLEEGLWTFRRKARMVFWMKGAEEEAGKASCIRIFARELLVRIKKRNNINVFLKVLIKSIK